VARGEPRRPARGHLPVQLRRAAAGAAAGRGERDTLRCPSSGSQAPAQPRALAAGAGAPAGARGGAADGAAVRAAGRPGRAGHGGGGGARAGTERCALLCRDRGLPPYDRLRAQTWRWSSWQRWPPVDYTARGCRGSHPCRCRRRGRGSRCERERAGAGAGRTRTKMTTQRTRSAGAASAGSRSRSGQSGRSRAMPRRSSWQAGSPSRRRCPAGLAHRRSGRRGGRRRKSCTAVLAAGGTRKCYGPGAGLARAMARMQSAWPRNLRQVRRRQDRRS
jgi:hypothetical protein